VSSGYNALSTGKVGIDSREPLNLSKTEKLNQKYLESSLSHVIGLSHGFLVYRASTAKSSRFLVYSPFIPLIHLALNKARFSKSK
jgi:hypothetical protein